MVFAGWEDVARCEERSACRTTSLGGGGMKHIAHIASHANCAKRDKATEPAVASGSSETDMNRVIRYRDGSSNYMCVQPRKDLQT